jgi:hypothetical protein
VQNEVAQGLGARVRSKPPVPLSVLFSCAYNANHGYFDSRTSPCQIFLFLLERLENDILSPFKGKSFFRMTSKGRRRLKSRLDAFSGYRPDEWRKMKLRKGIPMFEPRS